MRMLVMLMVWIVLEQKRTDHVHAQTQDRDSDRTTRLVKIKSLSVGSCGQKNRLPNRPGSERFVGRVYTGDAKHGSLGL